MKFISFLCAFVSAYFLRCYSISHPNYPLFTGDNLIFDLFLTDTQSGDTLDAENEAPDFRLIQTIDASDQVLSDNEFSIVESAVKIYPNPTNRMVHFKHTEIIEEILVYSMSGQLVHQIKFDQTSKNVVTLDMSSLNKGIYFASIHTDSEIFTKKIVKN